MKPNNIKILEKLEKFYNVTYIYKYKTSTAWINIKNYIYAKSLNYNFFVENQKFNKKIIFYFIFLSFINLFRQKGNVLFVSAGSGIVKEKNDYIDIYKGIIKEKNVLYFSSFTRLDKMYHAKEYYKKNKIVVYSLIFSVIRNTIAKLIKNSISLEDIQIIQFLQRNKIDINIDDIKYVYAKFKVGYELYRFLFKFYNIKKAYIVSSYTNTEIIAALKDKNIEIIEIQHGLIGPIHRGYNYKVKSQLLPTPDKIIVYDKFWKQELLDAGFYKKNQIEVLKKYQYEIIKDMQIFDKKFIVFTGQGLFKEEIKKFLQDSISFLKQNNIYLVYLPHPSEQYNFNILNKYIKIIYNKEYITEQYIKSAIAHISIYSSCHFDAVYFHSKTYILDIMDNNPMVYYLKKYDKQFISIKKINNIKL